MCMCALHACNKYGPPYTFTVIYSPNKNIIYTSFKTPPRTPVHAILYCCSDKIQ